MQQGFVVDTSEKKEEVVVKIGEEGDLQWIKSSLEPKESCTTRYKCGVVWER